MSKNPSPGDELQDRVGGIHGRPWWERHGGRGGHDPNPSPESLLHFLNRDHQAAPKGNPGMQRTVLILQSRVALMKQLHAME